MKKYKIRKKVLLKQMEILWHHCSLKKEATICVMGYKNNSLIKDKIN